MKDTAAIRLACAACGLVYPETEARTACSCGGLLELEYPLPPVSGEILGHRFRMRRGEDGALARSGVWRFRELVQPAIRDDVVTLEEGNTPLLADPRIARFAGLERIALKHEGLNPTGSFKDRGMTVGVTQARRIGATAVACASTGNTAASLGAYAARAGLSALVLVPEGQVSPGKLVQAIAAGARTVQVRGSFDDCLRLIREAETRLGVYLLNSINPFRIAGQQAIVYELLEQSGWDPPDWIALPAGNLGNTAAFGAALRRALATGLIPRLPRLAAVQASGAAPFAAGYAEGFVARRTVEPQTVATAIRIGAPASWERGVAAIRDTDGVVTTVSDTAILEAKAVIDAAGIGCEPASAASVAGVKRLVSDGVIAPGDRVVAVLTGHLLKDTGAVLSWHQELAPPERANRPVTIEPDLAALDRVLAGAQASASQRTR